MIQNVQSSDIDALKTINILEEVLGKNICSFEGRQHPEIIELECKDYQEQFDELYSDSGKPLGCYKNNNEEILTKEEFEALPKFPKRLRELIRERRKYLKIEAENGIVHGQFDFLTSTPVPNLVFRIPNEQI